MSAPTVVATPLVPVLTDGAPQAEVPAHVNPIPACFDTHALETSSKSLQIINRYRMKKEESIYGRADESVLKFIALIYTHVKASHPVPLCLPAFPFKSPNSTSKVLGKLPDRAEEVALSHLNGLCLAIGDIYPPGARLTIISDGLVYNGTDLTFPITPNMANILKIC